MQLDGIKEYWSFCGEIEDLDVMRFPDTGRFKGIAFITYTTVSFSPMPASHAELTMCANCQLSASQFDLLAFAGCA